MKRARPDTADDDDDAMAAAATAPLSNVLASRIAPLGLRVGEQNVRVIDQDWLDARPTVPREDGFLGERGHPEWFVSGDSAPETWERLDMLQQSPDYRMLTQLAGIMGVEPHELLSDEQGVTTQRLEREIQATLRKQRDRLLQDISEKQETISFLREESVAQENRLVQLHQTLQVCRTLTERWAWLLTPTGYYYRHTRNQWDCVPARLLTDVLYRHYTVVTNGGSTTADLDTVCHELHQQFATYWTHLPKAATNRNVLDTNVTPLFFAFGGWYDTMAATPANPLAQRGATGHVAATFLLMRDEIFGEFLALRCPNPFPGPGDGPAELTPHHLADHFGAIQSTCGRVMADSPLFDLFMGLSESRDKHPSFVVANEALSDLKKSVEAQNKGLAKLRKRELDSAFIDSPVPGDTAWAAFKGLFSRGHKEGQLPTGAAFGMAWQLCAWAIRTDERMLWLADLLIARGKSVDSLDITADKIPASMASSAALPKLLAVFLIYVLQFETTTPTTTNLTEAATCAILGLLPTRSSTTTPFVPTIQILSGTHASVMPKLRITFPDAIDKDVSLDIGLGNLWKGSPPVRATIEIAAADHKIVFAWVLRHVIHLVADPALFWTAVARQGATPAAYPSNTLHEIVANANRMTAMTKALVPIYILGQQEIMRAFFPGVSPLSGQDVYALEPLVRTYIPPPTLLARRRRQHTATETAGPQQPRGTSESLGADDTTNGDGGGGFRMVPRPEFFTGLNTERADFIVFWRKFLLVTPLQGTAVSRVAPLDADFDYWVTKRVAPALDVIMPAGQQVPGATHWTWPQTRAAVRWHQQFVRATFYEIARRYATAEAQLPAAIPMTMLWQMLVLAEDVGDKEAQTLATGIQSNEKAIAAAIKEAEGMAASNVDLVLKPVHELIHKLYMPSRAWQLSAIICGRLVLKAMVVMGIARAYTDMQRFIVDEHGRRIWEGVPLDLITGVMTTYKYVSDPTDPAKRARVVDKQLGTAPASLVTDFTTLVGNYVNKQQLMFPRQYNKDKQYALSPEEFRNAAQQLRLYSVRFDAGTGQWIITSRPNAPMPPPPRFLTAARRW